MLQLVYIYILQTLLSVSILTSNLHIDLFTALVLISNDAYNPEVSILPDYCALTFKFYM